MFNVVILDENWYYTQGMVELLQNYFYQRNQKVNCYINDETRLLDSDIILKSDTYRLNITKRSNCLQHYLNVAISPGPYLYTQNNVIFRDDSVDCVMKKLDKNWGDLQPESSKKVLGMTFQARSKLSKTEIIVMNLAGKGKSPVEVANILDKSVKTVSSQKRSAMRKLNLRNDYEYYKCIRQHAAQFEILYQLWWKR